MCRDIRQELHDLDIQACGSLSDAEAQRLIHQTLYANLKRAARSAHWSEYDAAVAAWDDHIQEHRDQARAIRAGREK